MRARLFLAPLLLASLSLSCGDRGGEPGARPVPPAASRTPSTAPAPVPPPQTARPAPALKRTGLTRADREPWRQALGWPADCEEAFQASAVPEAPGVEVYALSPGHSLVEVRCAWGAYQGSQLCYLYDETRQPPGALPLTFEVRESPDDRSLVKSETREVWGLPTFDPRTGRLSVLNKFRGPGDC